MREAADVTKDLAELKQPGSGMPRLMSEMGAERDEVYDSYEAPETPPAEEPKEPEVKEDAETPEPEKAEFVKEDKPKEEKLVPLDALHEERAKRKALSSEVKELKGNLSQLMEDNKKLMELMSDKSTDEPITDYEKELVNAKKQLKLMNEKITAFERSQKSQSEKTEAETLTALIKATDAELAKEGFEGFDDFVPQIIRAMNEEEIPPEDRNPATWKKVYKEIVWPKYIGKFKQDPKESKKSEKEALKKDASLSKSPGKVDAKKEDGDDMTSYMKMREKFSFMNRA